MADADTTTISRAERKRQVRIRGFVDAAKGIVARDGFEGLTMSRLANELDTVVSAVYRYFPSKGALLAEIQKEAIERLTVSLSTISALNDSAPAFQEVGERQESLVRLVLFGRWFCATSETYPEELRLLQMIMSQRESVLDPEGGARIFPLAMGLLSHAVVAIEVAQHTEAIEPGNSIDRAALWASALSGVMETDDLEKYVPELFGGARLARLANLDLIRGWGADADMLAAANDLVDSLGAATPLAP